MKLKIASLLLLAVSIAAGASAQEKLNKTVDGLPYEILKISGPVTVELIESANPSVTVSGDYKVINGVDISWSKKDLLISYSSSPRATRPVVKVYGYNLKEIMLEDGANVYTTKPLHSPRLFLTVNDDAHARILNYGKIRVFGNGHVIVKNLEAEGISYRK